VTTQPTHDVNEGKANFDDIYTAEDPRAYFSGLGVYGYEITRHGQAIFQALLDARQPKVGDRRQKVVDLCCSYGIIGALLKCDLTLDDLYAHYLSDEVAVLTSDELAAVDRVYFREHLHPAPPTVVGVDAAENAVRYALRSNLLDGGEAADLESQEAASAELARDVAGADLITSTGGVGYISEATFRKLLDTGLREHKPWVASFMLRMFTYERQFKDADEQRHCLEVLEGMGVDPTGREADGAYHTELYLSRPAEDVEAAPIGEILAGALTTAT
jgi:hypothetical protein